MSEETPPGLIEAAGERPSVAQLFSQLGSEAVDFAAAEMAVMRAELSSRSGIAKPGIFLVIVGIALVFGTTIALPIAALIILTPLIGAWLALLCVVGSGSITAFACFKLGIHQLKAALKRPDNHD